MYVMQSRNPPKIAIITLIFSHHLLTLAATQQSSPGQEHRCALCAVTGAMVVAHRGKVSWIHGAMRAGWTLVISGVSATV